MKIGDDTITQQMVAGNSMEILGNFGASGKARDVGDYLKNNIENGIEFDSWAQASAWASLRVDPGWNISPTQIVRNYSDKGNCHGFTFFGDSEAEVAVSSMETAERLLAGLPQGTAIAICLRGNVVGHSAVRVGQEFVQRLPGCPTFKTTLGFLKQQYDQVVIREHLSESEKKMREMDRENFGPGW